MIGGSRRRSVRRRGKVTVGWPAISRRTVAPKEQTEDGGGVANLGERRLMMVGYLLREIG